MAKYYGDGWAATVAPDALEMLEAELGSSAEVDAFLIKYKGVPMYEALRRHFGDM